MPSNTTVTLGNESLKIDLSQLSDSSLQQLKSDFFLSISLLLNACCALLIFPLAALSSEYKILETGGTTIHSAFEAQTSKLDGDGLELETGSYDSVASWETAIPNAIEIPFEPTSWTNQTELEQSTHFSEALEQADALYIDSEPSSELDLGQWWLTLYGGVLSSRDLGRLPRKWENAYDLGLGATRIIYDNNKNFSLEADGTLLQHFGQQSHQEVTAGLALRWHDFPWDDTVDTSFAIGDGLSWASQVPEFENRNRDRSTQLLNYLFFEFAFSRPQHPGTQLVFRLHHRSGIYGTFDGVRGGSNVYNLGLRFKL